MKLVYSNQNIAQVGLTQSFLAEHDIPSEMRNQYASSVMGEVSFFSVWPECWVSDADAEQALLLLGQLDTISSEAVEWQCNACGEQSPANFNVCWNCQSTKT